MHTKKINQIIAIFFCLAILTQNGVESPVLCFETDGHVNLEAACDISCKIPAPKPEEHQDECYNCFDLHLWNYNPDLTFISKSVNNHLNDYLFFNFVVTQKPNQIVAAHSYIFNNPQLQLPPFLKNTILLTRRKIVV